MSNDDRLLCFERLLQNSLEVKQGILAKAIVDVSKLEVANEESEEPIC